MIKTVIFDWGGVLIDSPTLAVVRYLAQKLNIDETVLIELFKKYENDFHTGTIAENAFWAIVSEKINTPINTSASLLYEALWHVYSPRKKMFETVASLRGMGYKTGLLSNAEIPTSQFFYKQHPHLFDKLIFSCDHRTRKPEKEIYEIALKELGVQPHEAIFIDDLPENIESAKKVGLHAILYSNPSLVKAEIVHTILKEYQIEK
ncbi:MAG: HAD family phosphatase [Parcubacteria group bacterium]|nr:HAD family phosphatase [Parcubacteria group bacterium]